MAGEHFGRPHVFSISTHVTARRKVESEARYEIKQIQTRRFRQLFATERRDFSQRKAAANTGVTKKYQIQHKFQRK